MALVFVTRRIPEVGIKMLEEAGHEVDVSSKDGVLTPDELKGALQQKPYEALVSLLTDTIDEGVLVCCPSLKICANYAVGFNNINLEATKSANIQVTNTPDVLTDTVAEFAVASVLALAKRIPEADKFTKALKYEGWAPELLLGSDLKGKTLGILGCGRIGVGVAERLAKGFGMKVAYYDIQRSEYLETSVGAVYYDTAEAVLEIADVVSLHVPLLDSTRHLINADRLKKMKKGALLVNTSRGPVIDEQALFEALRSGVIGGAALDVFENEPAIVTGLEKLDNVILTPHIASATHETRNKMSEMVANNVLVCLRGEIPPNLVK